MMARFQVTNVYVSVAIGWVTVVLLIIAFAWLWFFAFGFSPLQLVADIALIVGSLLAAAALGPPSSSRLNI